MANITITTIDNGSLQLGDEVYRDELLTLAGADTIAVGTILARDSVSLKLVLFVKGGATNENGIPKAVLVTEAVSTGAGDVPVRPLISGKVDASRLIIDADGDASNVDAAVLDQLRSYGVIGVSATDLSTLDNGAT